VIRTLSKNQNPALKNLSTVLGRVLVVLSLVYVANFIWIERAKLADWQLNSNSLIIFVVGVFLYAMNNFLLSSSWVMLLNFFGSGPINEAALRSVYATSQIAKYIPGNIAQFVGRHVMGRGLGVNHATLVLASIYEILGLCVTAIGVGVVGGFALGIGVEWPFTVSLTFLLAGFICFILLYYLGPFFFPILLKKFDIGFEIQNFEYIKCTLLLSRILFRYFAFFVCAGTILLGIAFSFVKPPPTDHIGLLLIAFSVSWVAGFITPGAPSGIGVREAIIVYMLQAAITPSMALMVAMLFRVITILGDVLFLFIDHLYKKEKSLSKN